MYAPFNRDFVQTFSKLNRNIMYCMQCDILSKDGSSHMDSRTTLSNGRTVKGNGSITLCIHFLGLSVYYK